MLANLHLGRLSDYFLSYLISFSFVFLAIPGVAAKESTIITTNGQVLQALQDPNVAFLDSNGTITVYSPITGQEIPQGLASDGGGSGFSPCAIAWIAFSFTVGAPLLFLGIRGWRFTIGATIGLAASLACQSTSLFSHHLCLTQMAFQRGRSSLTLWTTPVFLILF